MHFSWSWCTVFERKISTTKDSLACQDMVFKDNLKNYKSMQLFLLNFLNDWSEKARFSNLF